MIVAVAKGDVGFQTKATVRGTKIVRNAILLRIFSFIITGSF